jgi:hypothetical protein
MKTNELQVRVFAEIAGRNRPGTFADPFTVTKRRRFVAKFGVDPLIVVIIWNIIIEQANIPTGATS